ncbi:MAG TPA: oxidoreductase-like domain-containing protein [Xanthomonadales bacterium]|nr:oxidoreductase-like domain-containing protein [Xanthomonadales bacterium]
MDPGDDPKPQPPQKPGAAECCEAGCDRCVFDVYADELEHYRVALARWQARQPGIAASEGDVPGS